MKHCGTGKLETERLILRRFSMEDAPAMYQNWASDDEVTKYLTWPTHSCVEVTQTVIGDWLKLYEDDNFYQWAITVKEKGEEPIGSIAAVIVKDEVSMVQLGYCIAKRWWHQGITSEALKVVMDFFFDVVGANRVELKHDPRNVNSGRVMKKCGLQYEGTLRGSDLNNQGICDASYYGLLKSDR